MSRKNPRFRTLDDVRAWKTLKSHELELEKLKLQQAGETLKSDVVRRASKYFFLEIAMVFGEMMMMTLGKKFLGRFMSGFIKPGDAKKVKQNSQQNTA